MNKHNKQAKETPKLLDYVLLCDIMLYDVEWYYITLYNIIWHGVIRYDMPSAHRINYQTNVCLIVSEFGNITCSSHPMEDMRQYILLEIYDCKTLTYIKYQYCTFIYYSYLTIRQVGRQSSRPIAPDRARSRNRAQTSIFFYFFIFLQRRIWGLATAL